ncbi:hypothetical protein [Longibacter salinarum]|uniref:hypothetical protein n=1 Tax=Longibacter salinarum TaxID=1850348 RepID=UPI0015CF0286|nr:hypothetical protein [Longibacter salinarum]
MRFEKLLPPEKDPLNDCVIKSESPLKVTVEPFPELVAVKVPVLEKLPPTSNTPFSPIVTVPEFVRLKPTLSVRRPTVVSAPAEFVNPPVIVTLPDPTGERSSVKLPLFDTDPLTVKLEPDPPFIKTIPSLVASPSVLLIVMAPTSRPEVVT